MKIVLIAVGKIKQDYLITGILDYKKRLKRYIDFDIIEISKLKKTNNLIKSQITEKEGKLILNELQEKDYVILLDQKGVRVDSLGFANLLNKYKEITNKKIVFIIGGAYGFSKEIYKRSNKVLSFSSMTFTHQMIRLFFLEQLYRGFSILSNQPYHHE
tara:strand:- start:774 stop:1247 length:474 start_codon:yes stop_codon:yes gene_type:complete